MCYILLCILFLLSLLIGSFLNVCIYRIPAHKTIVRGRSMCDSCGHVIRWYDNIPILSYLILHGKCRDCGVKLSVQYPLVEGANAVLYLLIILVNGFNPNSILYCFLASALLVLSVIDFRTYEIPFGINVFIFALGVIHACLNDQNLVSYLIGMAAVGVPLFLIYLLTGKKGIGGGDIKLMAAAGLLLGWKLIILAFLLGCILGSVIHLLRMKLAGASRVLALGPYLSAGILIAVLFGNRMISWYFGLFG